MDDTLNKMARHTNDTTYALIVTHVYFRCMIKGRSRYAPHSVSQTK